LALTVTPALTIYGLFNVKWNTYTAIWSVVYYFVTGLGITAGYHVSISAQSSTFHVVGLLTLFILL
jgi:fatty-acid desaturase